LHGQLGRGVGRRRRELLARVVSEFDRLLDRGAPGVLAAPAETAAAADPPAMTVAPDAASREATDLAAGYAPDDRPGTYSQLGPPPDRGEAGNVNPRYPEQRRQTLQSISFVSSSNPDRGTECCGDHSEGDEV
jgi:hypothetical protein